MKLKKILVPTDFSEFSDYAADYGLFLAEKFGAEVTLLHAVVLHYADIGEKEHLEEYEVAYRRREDECFRLLRKVVDNSDRPAVNINSHIVRGFNAADAILEYFRANDNYDMIVMGTHGRSGFKKMLYGSVAEKIVRLSPIPVMTTHAPLKKFALERILVPVDFSEYSKLAVDTALEMRSDFKAELIFLHVIEDTIHPSFYAANLGMFDLNPGIKERSLERLKSFVGQETGCSYLVVSGTPFKEIVDCSAAMNVDLVLAGTRGLSGLEHWLVGSTTERVVRLAKMPVMTVGRSRNDERKTEDKDVN